jgi:membrane-associated phospholipid phosphatase
VSKQVLAVLRGYVVEAGAVGTVALLLILYVDLPVARRLAHTISGTATGDPVLLLDRIAHLGRGEYYLAFAVPGLMLGIWLLLQNNQQRIEQGWRILRASALIAGTLALGHLMVFALKQTVARLRPSEYLEGGLHGFADPFSGAPFTSLPSSHAFTAFAMAAVLSRLQPGLRAVFFGAALLVALQRMMALHHFLSDIFISLFLALMVSEMMQAVWRRSAPLLARRLSL